MMGRFYKVILIFAFCVLNFIGCAQVKEGIKSALAISTKELEDARQDAIKDTFRYNYDSCYKQTLEILKKIEAYLYAQDKKQKLIALYVSAEDTTPVGLFFKEIDTNNTQIEVSSRSTYAKEYIATKVFSQLIIALNPVEEK